MRESISARYSTYKGRSTVHEDITFILQYHRNAAIRTSIVMTAMVYKGER
jgi:hypothetical protein